jgi:hypothetical protein
MATRSPGLKTALLLASLEAQRGRHAQVVPEHLLMGLCSLEKALALTRREP